MKSLHFAACLFAILAAPAMVAAPNLTPYQPSGWSGKIVVSRSTGSNSDSSNLTPSDNLYIDWAVLNNGTTATASTFSTSLYVDGALWATWSTSPPLNSNYYIYITDYWIGTLSAGSHTLRIKTDSSGAVSESSESDNEYTKTISVNGGSPNLTPYQPSGWSDEIVVSKTTGTNSDSSGLTTSDNLYIDWAVINNGSTATASTFSTQLYVDGVLRTTWSTSPPLNSGYYTYITDYWIGTLSAGSHTLRIKTDSGGAISESSESDNEYSRTISVSGGSPNLTPYQPSGWSDEIVVSKTTGTSTDSSGLTTSDSLYIDWAVINNGGSATAATFSTQLFVDGVLKTTWSTSPPLNSGYYTYITDYWLGTLSAGSHTLRIKTDSGGMVAESSEGDNEYTKTITVSGGSPNLTPYTPSGWSDEIVVSKTTGTNTDSSGLTTSDSLYIDWAVINNGGSATASTFQTQLFVDGVQKATWSTSPPLNASYYTYITDYWLGALSAGTHTLRIKTDAAGTIAESSEGDNEYTKTITVSGGSPNLTPYTPSGWSDKIVASRTTGTNTDSTGLTATDNLYIDWAVINNGGSATATTFQTQLFVDGVQKATWSTSPPLNANYYTYITDFPLGKLAAGTHTLRVKTDAGGTLAESNESDNEYTRTIVVGGDLPNLTPYQPSGWSSKIVISKVTATNTDAASFAATDTLYIDWAVFNNGGSSTATLFQTQLFVDGVLKATWSTNPPLNASYYTYITDFPLGKLAAGSHTFRLKTDAGSTIAETNEADNEFTRTIVVGSSSSVNLAPFQPSGWSDEIVASKVAGTTSDSALSSTDSIYVDWAVINNGTAATATTFSTQLFVDGVLYGTWSTSPPLNANYYTYITDFPIGKLGAGTHTLRIKTDAGGAIAESSETDNETTKTIIVGGITAPNLTPYQPSGWSNKIVVSTVTGTTTDSATLTSSNALYIDWAVTNNGGAATPGIFSTQLFVNGVLQATWQTSPSLGAGLSTSVSDYWLGKLPVGTYTLRIKTDAGGAVTESSETDNEYSRTITVTGTGSVNLTPYQPAGWSGKIVVSNKTGTTTDTSGLTAADTLYVDWAVLNGGPNATATTFSTQLFVDGEQKATWPKSPPINAGSSTTITDYPLGRLSPGSHTLRIKTDAGGAIAETNESDNETTKVITIAPRAIFVGIFGGDSSGIGDDEDELHDFWRNSEIKDFFITPFVEHCVTNTCSPTNDNDLTEIAQDNDDVGGLVSIGYFMTSFAGGSQLNIPGNSDIPKNYIVDNYKPGTGVYVAGHSVGGGDTQNVLVKLNSLGIKVGVSGHIDSVDLFEDDATIPANTAVAKGYYQTQIFPRGEDELEAANPAVTTISNTLITDPVGPDSASVSGYHHRNMDNDSRVWLSLKNAIDSSTKTSQNAASVAQLASTLAHDNPRTAGEWTRVLERALEANASGDELYELREQFAATICDVAAFHALINEYARSAANPDLAENLLAVILKTSADGLLPEMRRVGMETDDYALFVALVHSIGRTGTIEAKQSLLQLVDQNMFNETSDKAIAAIVSASYDRIDELIDPTWMLEWVTSGMTSERQIRAMRRMTARLKGNSNVQRLHGEIEKRLEK